MKPRTPRRKTSSGEAIPSIAVVGSVNLDLVMSVPRLPEPGETVTGARLARHPGGKGANQALAARRLGAEVALFAAVGSDPEADAALALLRAEGVDLSACERCAETPTGLALITVAQGGENQIVVAPGANANYAPDVLDLARFDAVICQLEIPTETIARAAAACCGFFCLNLAPARPLPDAVLGRADLVVVNEGEARQMAPSLVDYPGLLAVTHGAQGAELRRRGEAIATAHPPPVTAVDSTGAGDAFTAALTLALIEHMPAPRALAFACTAGALAATGPGAQPALPRRAAIEAVLARAQPERVATETTGRAFCD